MILQWVGSRIAGKGINLSECWEEPPLMTLYQMLPWTYLPPHHDDGKRSWWWWRYWWGFIRVEKTRLLGHLMGPLMSLWVCHTTIHTTITIGFPSSYHHLCHNFFLGGEDLTFGPPSDAPLRSLWLCHTTIAIGFSRYYHHLRPHFQQFFLGGEDLTFRSSDGPSDVLSVSVSHHHSHGHCHCFFFKLSSLFAFPIFVSTLDTFWWWLDIWVIRWPLWCPLCQPVTPPFTRSSRLFSWHRHLQLHVTQGAVKLDCLVPIRTLFAPCMYYNMLSHLWCYL